MRRVESPLRTYNAYKAPQAERLFSMYCMPKALSHSRTGSLSIYMGYHTHILDGGMVEGPLVGRGYIFSWRKDFKAEGDEEEGGENLRDLYTTSVLSGLYNCRQCLGSNWIWLKESFNICHWHRQIKRIKTGRLPLAGP